MKTIYTWISLLTKRLLHKPPFLAALFLIPLSVLFLQRSIHSGDAILRVGLYTETTDSAAMERILLSQMTEESNHTISFYNCSSMDELETDIRDGKAVCGYVFPKHMEKSLQEYAEKNTAIITAYHPSGAVESLLLDELAYRMIYEELAYDILKQHVDTKTQKSTDSRLYSLYQSYLTEYPFIRFEYADGTQNRIINQEDSNYLLLPIRGISAVLILAAAMTGTIFWYDDRAHKVFIHLSESTHNIIKILYVLIPGILAGICGFLAILLTGFAARISQECLTMGLFLAAVTAYCMVCREILPDRNLYLAAIPISAAGSILLCPVFANLTASLPLLKPLQMLCPVYHYLNSIYNIPARGKLALYTIVMLLLAHGIHKAKTGRIRLDILL